MDFTEHKFDRKLWCSPALSYHHFSPGELDRMWRFEQAFIQSGLDKVTDEKQWTSLSDYSNILEHRDVFKHFVWPKIRESRSENWNNMSPTVIGETENSTLDDCKKLCEAHPTCLQFVSSPEGCSISYQEVKLGEEGSDTKSGWFHKRIERWMSNLDRCGGKEGWIKE